MHRGSLILAGVIAVAMSLWSVEVLLAATPSPASGGDPRSSGAGPGFVGDPGMAILITVALGVASVVVTVVYVRLTSGRVRGRDGDGNAP